MGLSQPQGPTKSYGSPTQDKTEAFGRVSPCTLFSTLQRQNPKPDEATYEKADAMVDFAVKMCIEQCRSGRLCIFEHLSTASSRKLPSLMKLSEVSGMREVTFDMCRFEMRVQRPDASSGLAKKRASFACMPDRKDCVRRSFQRSGSVRIMFPMSSRRGTGRPV